MKLLTPEQRDDMTEAAGSFSTTRRPTSPGMEAILGYPYQVLDHGFIRVVDYMGDDAAVVQAARVSYGRGTTKPSADAALIGYLMRHRHTTPFEMAEIKFHVKLPIFVARQWIRHRTASVNEVSARYSILDREFYVPAREDLAAQSTTNKQGRGEVLQGEEADRTIDWLTRHGSDAFDLYEDLLNENHRLEGHVGLARELSRMVLPLNTYTQWYWKVNVHNLMHFLGLRADPHAQKEIRVYADVMMDVLRTWMPATYAAFIEHRHGAFTLSASALKAVRMMLAGEPVTAASAGLPAREWADLMTAMNRVEELVA